MQMNSEVMLLCRRKTPLSDATPRPAYVNRNDQTSPQPFLLRNIRLYGLVLPADADSIQRNVCDRYFNIPSGGSERFRAASASVTLAFSRIEAISSTGQPCADYGYFPEQETGFWILMVDEKRERLCWTLPYLFVDSPVAIAAGREIYGFPKQMGRMNLPDTPTPADPFTLDALALETYSPDTGAAMARVVTARPAANVAPASGEWASLGEMMLSLVRILETQDSLFEKARLAYDSMGDLLSGRMPLVFLKQFRDVADGNVACYQSIVETAMEARQFHSAAWLAPHDVDINSYASLPIRTDLGLPAGTLRSTLSFTTNADYTIANGIELWKA